MRDNPFSRRSKPSVPTPRILGYAIGEGAISITMNGVSNFALLYYTSILHLGAGVAGLALSISVLWDAVIDPFMGHITDNTHSRWGRRMPYLLVGGLLLAPTFYLLWILPTGSMPTELLFILALLGNLLWRTAVAVFSIPYVALGFEVCPGYEDRSRLQGIRTAFNMAINLVFGAFAWTLFFQDQLGPNGARIEGTSVAGNYKVMGWVLAAMVVLMVLLCIWTNRHTAQDNRSEKIEGNSLRAFQTDFQQIFLDRMAWRVFGFSAIALLGMLFVSQMQMFVYVFFMQFSPGEKTFVHGGGMVAAALGALLQSTLTKKFDKKNTGYAAMVLGIAGGLLLFLFFNVGGLKPQTCWDWEGIKVPVALLIFALGQWLWWGGAGMLGPLAMSMVADLAEINYLRSGIRKDGGYSSVYTFLQKASMSLGLLLTGWLVAAAGIVSGAETQSSEAVGRIAWMSFLSGPLLMLVAYNLLRGYPVTRRYLEEAEAAKEKKGDSSPHNPN